MSNINYFAAASGRKIREDGKVVNIAHAYDETNEMFKVSSMQKKFRDSFPGVALDNSKWDAIIGTGGNISVGGGTIILSSGTTANSETYILSKEVFTIPFKLSAHVLLSQRIANQRFFIEAVSIDPITLEPDGLHCASVLFDGTAATSAKYRVQNSGVAPLDSSASTMTTTASPGGVYEIEPFGDECWFHSSVLDSANGRSNSYRRHQLIPDPNALYKIRLRWENLSTAPASNTNATCQFVACQDYAELTCEVTSGRGSTSPGQGIYATVAGSVTVTSNTPATPTAHNLNAAATTNATSIKTSAGSLYSTTANNIGSVTRYLKYYNKASAPTVGTDTPVLTIPIHPNSVVDITYGVVGHRFTTGIALAVTTGGTDTDTVAVSVANEVKVITSYI